MAQDANWNFKKKCEEYLDDAWKEALENIRTETSNDDFEDRLSEVANSCVPTYTKDLWDLVEHLEEHWDEAKGSETLDEALRYSVYMAASDNIYEAFNTKGGTDRLEELSEMMDTFRTAIKDNDIETVKSMIIDNKQDLIDIGYEVDLPTDKPAPKMGM